MNEVKPARPDCTIVAGAGSNDTRHAVHLTERATELGADAILSVTPYYNRPNRRGIIRHYEEIDRATDKPIVLYNIPQRTAVDMSNDLLAELAQLERVDGGKAVEPRRTWRSVDGLQIYAGNDEDLPTVLELGEPGGILVDGAPVRRKSCTGWWTSPSIAGRSTPAYGDVYRDLAVAPAGDETTKAALEHDRPGRGRAPAALASSFDGARAEVIRDDARTARTATSRPMSVSEHAQSPAAHGGLGEIGKNMTVVEYDDRIVVVDAGLRFPTTDMLGIDLVLPDFSYLRERVEDIEAIVITHGHDDIWARCRGSCASSAPTTRRRWYGGQLSMRWLGPSSTSTGCARRSSRTSAGRPARARAVPGSSSCT